jgi:hypothetical protein
MTMKAYEFSATVTPDGKLAIPDTYAQDMPIGDAVRVIVLVDETEAAKAETLDNFLSLEKVIAEIRNTPSNPANIQPASGLLAEHLANSPGEPDPNFDVAAWNSAWDKIEAEMEAAEVAHEQAETDI